MILITLFAILIHIAVCIDMSTFKRSVSIITKNYTLFKVIFPIIYLVLGINIYTFLVTFNDSKRLYTVYLLYIMIVILTIISSLALIRFANFILSFWCLLLCLILDIILSYILFIASPNFLYLGGIHIVLYCYLDTIVFWLYSNNI